MLKQTLVLGLLTLSGLYSAHAQEVLTLEKALNHNFHWMSLLSGIPVTTNTIISTVNGMPTRPKCHRLHSVSRNP